MIISKQSIKKITNLRQEIYNKNKSNELNLEEKGNNRDKGNNK